MSNETIRELNDEEIETVSGGVAGPVKPPIVWIPLPTPTPDPVTIL